VTNKKIFKIIKIQNGVQDGGQDGSSKLLLAIPEPFMTRFGSNLNCTHRIKCQKSIKELKNGGKNGVQDCGSKHLLAIFMPFINRFGTHLNSSLCVK